MRSLAFMAIVLGCGAAQVACGQSASAQALSGSALARAPFAASTPADSFTALVDQAAAAAPVQWNSNQVQLSRRADGPVDSLRVSAGAFVDAPAGLPVHLDPRRLDDKAYEVSVIRNWPRAMAFDNGKFDLDVSPRAGLGMTSQGASAEAGAELRLSKSKDDRAKDGLRAMGVTDGAHFGDQGRWYLFAAASGRAVGLNMLRNDGAWDRAGWTTDPTSTLIGDAQVGVGFRKGAMQTSFGFIHREVKGQHMVFGQETKDDSLVAFSLSIRPKAK
jgi:hypothetical protein